MRHADDLPVTPSAPWRAQLAQEAAAVGANMVPLAIGSQTNGSTIRPAAYCGVVGFKPTHGLISRHRVLTLSRTLDHVGLFARSVDDIALLTEQLTGYDENDRDTQLRAEMLPDELLRERMMG